LALAGAAFRFPLPMVDNSTTTAATSGASSADSSRSLFPTSLSCVDNPNTQQTPEYTKDKYNVKIMK
jgi:hypothetical protein